MEISVSIAQVKLNINSFEENRDNTLYLIDKMPVMDNHFLLLPELWSTGFSQDMEAADKFNKELLIRLQTIARQKDIFIAGSYIVKQSHNIYSNQLIMISRDGKIVARYDKMHLFFQFAEKERFSPGKTPVILNTRNLNIGFSICYDLRFPELFRTYAKNAVSICFLPAQWPTKRISHYSNLLIARAIENQMVMVSANIVGKVKNTLFGGNSMVVDYMGNPLISLSGNDNTIATTTINTGLLFDWRKKFPVLNDIDRTDYSNIELFRS